MPANAMRACDGGIGRRSDDGRPTADMEAGIGTDSVKLAGYDVALPVGTATPYPTLIGTTP